MKSTTGNSILNTTQEDKSRLIEPSLPSTARSAVIRASTATFIFQNVSSSQTELGARFGVPLWRGLPPTHPMVPSFWMRLLWSLVDSRKIDQPKTDTSLILIFNCTTRWSSLLPTAISRWVSSERGVWSKESYYFRCVYGGHWSIFANRPTKVTHAAYNYFQWLFKVENCMDRQSNSLVSIAFNHYFLCRRFS